MNPSQCKRDTFNPETYENCILYVNEDALETYRNKESWSEFINIKAFDFSEVEELDAMTENSGMTVIYDLDGRIMNKELSDLEQGIYVVRNGNRTVKVRK